MNNEKTGKAAAGIAAKVLKRLAKSKGGAVYADEFPPSHTGHGTMIELCTVDELKVIAASDLTQAPDRPKRKRKARLREK